MRIVHICLANFYVDGMGYQENLITKVHAEDHEVFILTSDYAFNSSGDAIKKVDKNYINQYGISVKVLERSKRYWLYSRYNDFNDVYASLSEIRPDVIFCHGGQFIALKDVIKYCKRHKETKLYIDQHADYYNTPVNTLRRRLAQKYIYGYWMRKAVPYVTKFWGVTPWRCDYLHEVYGIPKDKIDFLPMGGDDDKIHLNDREIIRKEIRKAHNIAEDDFLIVTGGKIDKAKRIDMLMEAVIKLNLDKVKLLVFGQPSAEMLSKMEILSQDLHIRNIGWIPSDKVYDYFLASDLCAFPGTHSVLWEQACACGLPGIFREWEGMRHVDVGGNAIFLTQDSAEEISRVVMEIYNNPAKLIEMRKVAREEGIPKFSYKKIAQKAISKDC